MKKIVILFVMMFAFGLTQAGNHSAVQAMKTTRAHLQKAMAIQNTTMQDSPVFNLMEGETVSGHHGRKTKQPKADKKPKVKKEKQHKTEAERKAEHKKKEQQRKAKHHKTNKGNHHHHKNNNK